MFGFTALSWNLTAHLSRPTEENNAKRYYWLTI